MKFSTNQPGIPPVGGPQRTFGVEEEFLLVDPDTGQPVPAAEQAMRHAPKNPRTSQGPVLALKVKQEQLEVVGPVCSTYTSGEEGIAVLDRIRVWLTVLLALSANSPFWQGTNRGYASFRYQAWCRWPTAGPCEQFEPLQEYLRLGGWLASEAGVEGNLLHPLRHSPRPATEAAQDLLAHIRPVLASFGDEEQVPLGLAHILAFSNGAHKQREAMVKNRSLTAVVRDAVERTHAVAGSPRRRLRHLYAT